MKKIFIILISLLIANSAYPDCIKWGAKIGGNKGGVFKKPFLKFFTENLL